MTDAIRRLARTAGAVIACASLLAPAFANAAQAVDPAVVARNTAIIDKTAGAAGVFKVEANGDIRHAQSGLRCPAAFPAAAFLRAEIFSPAGKGTDVGCDYGRLGPNGRAASELTILTTKSDTATLDDAFALDQMGVVKRMPQAKLLGPALTVSGAGKSEDPTFGAFRSAEYGVRLDGGRYISDLIVAVRHGWVIEIRATYLAASDDDADKSAKQPEDSISPAFALLAAIGSIGAAAPVQ